jgi:putative NADH-flavin reductase
MKLLISGPTGGTCAQHLSQALNAGHNVTVIVRNRRKIPVRDHASPTIITGDVPQPQMWKAAGGGHDAVLSCLGSRLRILQTNGR